MKKLIHFLLRFLPTLVISFFLWVFLQLNKEYEVPIQGTLVYQIPFDLQLMDSLPSSLYVILKGRGTDLFPYYVGLKPLRLTVELNEFLGNQIIRESHIVNLFQTQYPNLVLVHLEGPRQIFLSYIRRIKRTLPIENRMTIQPENGFYSFSPPRFTPSEVTVFASPSFFEGTNRWATIDTTITLNRSWQEGRVRLAPLKDAIVYPPAVNFYVEGKPYYPITLWLLVKVKNKPSQIHIQPIPQYVRVFCLIADTSHFTNLPLSVSIDFRELNFHNPLARLYVEYPQDLIPWLYTIPQVIHYRIRYEE
jgi:hypothetical protein